MKYNRGVIFLLFGYTYFTIYYNRTPGKCVKERLSESELEDDEEGIVIYSENPNAAFLNE